MGETLSYDEIRRIYRLEKNTSKLVDLDEDFFNQLNAFVQDQKQKYVAGLANFSVDEARDFANLKKMIDEIVVLRERKILNSALVASRSGEPLAFSLALPEKKMLNEVVLILQKQQALVSGMFGNGETNRSKKESGSLDSVSVRVLSEVPAFVGTDMKEYGPFSQNQKIVLPYKVAKLFFERKLAEPAGDD